MEQSKRCGRCRLTLSTSQFSAVKKAKSGLHSYCHACRKASARESYLRHRRSRIDRVTAYQASHPEQVSAVKRRWVERNPAKRRDARKRWQQANMQTIVRASNARRRAARVDAPSLPFTPQQLADRLSMFGNRCWICRADGPAIDHVKPLSRGGWHCLSNIRPACTACNTRKKDRWPYAA